MDVEEVDVEVTPEIEEIAKESTDRVLEEMADDLGLGRLVDDADFRDDLYGATVQRLARCVHLMPEMFMHQMQFAGFGFAREAAEEALYARGGTSYGESKLVPGGVLADEMGTGKSLAMLGVIVGNMPGHVDRVGGPDAVGPDPHECGRHNGKTLMIAPGNIYRQWLELLSGFADRLHIVVSFVGTVKAGRSRSTKYSRDANIVLVSAELLKFDPSIGWLYKDGDETVVWHRIVIDEGHMIKDRTTKTAKNAAKLRGVSRWIMSATPFQNGEHEMLSQLGWIGFPEHQMDTADKLEALMRRCMMQRTTEETGLKRDWELTYQPIKVPASPEAIKIFEAIDEHSDRSQSMARQQLMRQVLFDPSAIYKLPKWKAWAATNAEYLPDVESLGTSAPPLVKALIEHLATHYNKSVIFTHFTYEKDVILDALTEEGIKVELLTGEQDQGAKECALISFRSSDARVLLANINCGGTGLNLPHASVVYFLTTDYNPFNEVQAIARCARQGQNKDVVAVFFSTPLNSMETGMQKIQYKKIKKANQYMGPSAKISMHNSRLEEGMSAMDRNHAAAFEQAMDAMTVVKAKAPRRTTRRATPSTGNGNGKGQRSLIGKRKPAAEGEASEEPSGEVGEATSTPSGFSSMDPMKNSWRSSSLSPS